MEAFLIIANSMFTAYCYYAWRRNDDVEARTLALIGSFVVLLLLGQHYFSSSFPTGLGTVFRTLRYAGWLFILVALFRLHWSRK